MKIGIGNTTIISQGKGSPRDLITEWTVAAGETITLSGQVGGNYLFDVNWGDGTATTGLTTNSETHTYTNAGTYEVKISGQFAGFAEVDQKITKFVQWGDQTVIEGLAGMFKGGINMKYQATDNPIISLNPAVNKYDSGVDMFRDCQAINTLDLSGWVINGGPLLNLSSAFQGTFITELNVSNWDFSNVSNMDNFFKGNTILTNIDFPSNADYSSLTSAFDMITAGASITTAEYDNFLIRLDTTGQKGGTYDLNAGDSTYTGGGAAATARANLVAGGWNINDGGIA